MRILMVTPELAPVLSDGGVGEGVRALCDALQERGDTVTAILPGLPARERDVRVDEAPVALSHGASARRGHSGALPVVLVDGPCLAERTHLYGEDMGDLESAARAAFFCRAVVDWLRREAFDVVHAHEWVAAMVPYLLRCDGAGPPSVFTLHNGMHQGVFPKAALAPFGLDDAHFHMDRLEFHGRVNLTKGGVLAARFVTTVSPTYREELLTPAYGELLDGVLQSRGADFVGIENGIDRHLWDPARDANLAAPYDATNLDGKAACKAALAGELGFDAGRPLVVSVGRIIEQKGSDLLAAALPAMVARGACVLVAGAGDADLEAALARAAASAAPHARMLGRVPDALLHRLMAAADFVAMPSRYEPCGIVQLYALRYGALPIVRRTGGLADTVQDAAEAKGTGFLFDAIEAEALVLAVSRALSVYGTSKFVEMQRSAMARDAGWERPAVRYRHLYERATAR
jgi:starch synthase